MSHLSPCAQYIFVTEDSNVTPDQYVKAGMEIIYHFSKELGGDGSDAEEFKVKLRSWNTNNYEQVLVECTTDDIVDIRSHAIMLNIPMNNEDENLLVLGPYDKPELENLASIA